MIFYITRGLEKVMEAVITILNFELLPREEAWDGE
jgi:energy-converting hydrogenase Eha subunit F